jgi:hypothetical protein
MHYFTNLFAGRLEKNRMLCYLLGTLSISNFDCVFVASGVQDVMRIATLSIVACPGLQYFSRCLIMGRILERKKIIEYKIFVFIFVRTLCEKITILRRIARYVVTNVYWSVCKVPFILVKL